MKGGAHPLAGFDTLSKHHHSFATTVDESPKAPETNHRSFRGFFPYDVFPDSRSHLPPTKTPLRWLRCALRVSHPLNALLPSRPPKLISSWSRPWGLPFRGMTKTRSRMPSSSTATFVTFNQSAQRSEITSKLVCPVDRPHARSSPSRLRTSDPVPTRAPGVS